MSILLNEKQGDCVGKPKRLILMVFYRLKKLNTKQQNLSYSLEKDNRLINLIL